jgi:hypothetical protein
MSKSFTKCDSKSIDNITDVGISGDLTVTSPRPTAFVVEDASGNSVFVIDTVDQEVTVTNRLQVDYNGGDVQLVLARSDGSYNLQHQVRNDNEYRINNSSGSANTTVRMNGGNQLLQPLLTSQTTSPDFIIQKGDGASSYTTVHTIGNSAVSFTAPTTITNSSTTAFIVQSGSSTPVFTVNTNEADDANQDFKLTINTPVGATANPNSGYLYLDTAETMYIKSTERSSDTSNFISISNGSFQSDFYDTGINVSDYTLDMRSDATFALSVRNSASTERYFQVDADSSPKVRITITEVDAFSVSNLVGSDTLVVDTTNQQLLMDAENDVSNPAYSFIGDPDTGMYNISANTLGFSIGGSNMLQISTAESLFSNRIITSIDNTSALRIEDSSNNLICAVNTIDDRVALNKLRVLDDSGSNDYNLANTLGDLYWNGIPIFKETTTSVDAMGDGTNDFTLTTNVLTYQQVGNVITGNINIVWSSKGSASGPILIEVPSPITPRNPSVNGSITFTSLDNISFTGDILTGLIDTSGLKLYEYVAGTSSTKTQLIDTDFGSTGKFACGFQIII